MVQLPPLEDIREISSKTILLGILDPYKNKRYFDELKKQNITAITMELIPRISRAQGMDVLTSQANLAGYRLSLIHI